MASEEENGRAAGGPAVSGEQREILEGAQGSDLSFQIPCWPLPGEHCATNSGVRGAEAGIEEDEEKLMGCNNV